VVDREVEKVKLSKPGLSYKPIPVKEILMKMKNLSELIIDLSSCSLIFYDKRIIREVYRLEEEMDDLEAQLIMHAALATRNPDDAEKMVSVYNLAIAMDHISDAASDIARLAETGARLKASKEFFASSPTRFVYILPVSSESPLANKEINEIFNSMGCIFDVIAIRRKDSYIFEPSEDERILENDILYVKGSPETIDKLIELSGQKPEEEITIYEEGLLDNLLQLKEISQLMVDLAYSALLTRSREIVSEILEMENYVDELVSEVKDMVIISKDLSIKEKMGIIGLADAYEEIADAAVNIVYGLSKGLEPHPIIDAVIDEALERLAIIEVRDEMVGKTLSSLELAKKGIIVLAVKRGKTWIITPPYSRLKLSKGDMLVVKYYSEAEDEIAKLESKEAVEKLRREEAI